jgi:hypothetical protein
VVQVERLEERFGGHGLEAVLDSHTSSAAQLAQELWHAVGLLL